MSILTLTFQGLQLEIITPVSFKNIQDCLPQLVSYEDKQLSEEMCLRDVSLQFVGVNPSLSLAYVWFFCQYFFLCQAFSSLSFSMILILNTCVVSKSCVKKTHQLFLQNMGSQSLGLLHCLLNIIQV